MNLKCHRTFVSHSAGFISFPTLYWTNLVGTQYVQVKEHSVPFCGEIKLNKIPRKLG
jgi:hypothetical protein